MKKLYWALALISLIVLLLVIFVWKYSIKNSNNMFTVQELNNKSPASGSYYVKGFVIKIEDCSCSGDGCPNCIGRHIVISDTPLLSGEVKDRENYEKLYIFSENSGQFEHGEKYIFNVKILEGESKKIINALNAELISFDKA